MKRVIALFYILLSSTSFLICGKCRKEKSNRNNSVYYYKKEIKQKIWKAEDIHIMFASLIELNSIENIEFLKKMFDKYEWDVNTQNSDGETLMHILIKQLHNHNFGLIMADFLIKKNADLTIQTNDEQTVFDYLSLYKITKDSDFYKYITEVYSKQFEYSLDMDQLDTHIEGAEIENPDHLTVEFKNLCIKNANN